MGNRATITTAPFDRKNACIYVHWNGGRESIEAFCAAAKELGYRSPGSDGSYALARLTGLICTYFDLDADTSIGIGTLDELLGAGDDNGCFVLGDNWEIVERRDCNGRVFEDTFYTPTADDSPYAKLGEQLVAQVRRAADAAKQED
jgi:hypothetical protein